MPRTGFMQVFDGLINNLYSCSTVLRSNQCSNFGSNLFRSKGLIDLLNVVYNFFLWKFFLGFGFL